MKKGKRRRLERLHDLEEREKNDKFILGVDRGPDLPPDMLVICGRPPLEEIRAALGFDNPTELRPTRKKKAAAAPEIHTAESERHARDGGRDRDGPGL